MGDQNSNKNKTTELMLTTPWTNFESTMEVKGARQLKKKSHKWNDFIYVTNPEQTKHTVT